MRFIPVLLLLTLLVPNLAAAQRRDTREVRRDRREVRDDKREVADDRRDLASLTKAIDHWSANKGNRAEEARADAVLERWLRQELAEGRQELREDKREVTSSKSEVRDSRRENRRGGSTADDRRDLRDDKRDLRDDKRDVARGAANQERTRRIARELEAMQPAFAAGKATPEQYASKTALLVELRRVAVAEVKQSKGELREDKRETREDKRERRERRR
jgi:hypothetical protein